MLTWVLVVTLWGQGGKYGEQSVAPITVSRIESERECRALGAQMVEALGRSVINQTGTGHAYCFSVRTKP